MERASHPTRWAILTVVLLALSGAAVLLFGGRAAEAPTAGDPECTSPSADARGTISTPGLNPRPTAEPETVAPQAQRPPVPNGALRIRLRVRGRKKGDWTQVLVQVHRDDDHFALVLWMPDNPAGNAWVSGDATGLGQGVRFEGEESTSGEEGAVLLLGLVEGVYVADAVRTNPDLPMGQSRPTPVTVGAGGGPTVFLVIPPEGGEGELTVRVRRDGQPGVARVHVSAGPMTILRFEAGGEKGAVHSLPADIDLGVRVTSFEKSEEFGLPEPQRVRLEPGTSKEVTFDLPAGVQVTFRCAASGGQARDCDLFFWRMSESAPPHYAGNLAQWSRTRLDTGWTCRLPAGNYKVRAAAGDACGWASFEAFRPGPVDVRVELRSEGIRRINARFIEADGTPARQLGFQLRREDPLRIEDEWSKFGTTDDDGRALLALPEPGTFGIDLWNRGLHRRLDVGSETPTALELRLPPQTPADGTATLRGIVRTPAAMRTGSVRVLLDRQDLPWTPAAQTDRNGFFELTGIPTGDAQVRVPFSWYHEVAYRPFEQTIRLHAGDDNRLEIDLQAP